MTERLHFQFLLSCIGEGNGNPLQYFCLENPRDGESGGLLSMGLHSRTQLKQLSSSSSYLGPVFCIFLHPEFFNTYHREWLHPDGC